MRSSDLLRLKSLVGVFRSQGHQIACLDPLGRTSTSTIEHWEADPEAKRLLIMMGKEGEEEEASGGGASRGIPRHRHTRMDLQAGGFSSGVTSNDVVPLNCLNDILGPHWSNNYLYSETFDDKTLGKKF